MWLRESMGIQIKGDAWTIRPNIPKNSLTEGDVLLFNYGGKGKDHAALILSFEGKQQIGNAYAPEFINVIEANYDRCEVGTRKVRWDDPSIKGGFIPTPVIK